MSASPTRWGTTAARLSCASRPLDAKRKPDESGIDAWYPYYAGFSAEFAARVLAESRLTPEAVVLDPWNGAGTTLRVADKLQISAIGYDINPAAVLIANAKLVSREGAEEVVRFAEKNIRRIKRKTAIIADPLAPWLPPSAIAEYREIEAALLHEFDGVSNAPLDVGVSPVCAFALLTLMRAAKSLAVKRESTNPTWVVPASMTPEDSFVGLHGLWKLQVLAMTADVVNEGRAQSCTAIARIGDATTIGLPDCSVDFVLTSPPYCTRIDYVVSTSFELAAMGLGRDDQRFSELRRRCMGTSLITARELQDPLDGWPADLRMLLGRIRAHTSYASESYYYKTYWQYFRDCSLALREIRRTLKPGGNAVVVVQGSYYKDLFVDLPQLYVSMAQSIGLQASIVSRTPVRRVLASINTKSRKYKASAAYSEAVVVIEKSPA